MLKRFLIALFFASPLLADVNPNPVVVNVGSPFAGLYNQDNSLIIPPSNAQDLLNVDITPGGISVKKRHGYGLDATLSVSTSAVHNGYHFFDANGNDIRLWMSDTNISASKNSGSYSVVVSSWTVGATMQCTDSQGLAWCASTSNDQIIRTDGTNVTFFPNHPKGTLITAGPDRLAIANVSGAQNSIYFSASGDFTNETAGSQPTSPFVESILAPGSHLTHIKYWNGRYLWWKDQSFGYIIMQDQFNLQVIIVSALVGTYDNADVDNQGIVYFRGSDSHIWQYDGANLIRLTREITPIVTAANKRKSNSWLQTSQSDFQNGLNVPANNISETISPGDVIVGSFTVTENSSSQWNNGTANNISINSQSLNLSQNQVQLPNNSFESGDTTNWTKTGSSFSNITSFSASGCPGNVINPLDGTHFEQISGSLNETAYALSCDGLTTFASLVITDTATSCGWTQQTLSVTPYAGKCTKIKFNNNANNDNIVSDNFISNGNSIVFYSNDFSTNRFIDFVTNSPKSSITSGSFTSKIFDTAFTSSTIQLSNFAWTANTSTPTFSVQTATSNPTSNWITLLTSSGTNAVGNRYVQYTTTITVGSTDNALTGIFGATIIARSTGTYYSAVNNAPNLTSWGNLNITDSQPGASAITYYTRSSTTIFTVSGTTPTWIAQTKNATVSASTGTYFQLRADFSLVAATETPTLSDFTFNWFEGTASDQAYGTYFDFGIWWAISYSTSATTNNRILRYDLLNQTWTVYDITANGFLVQNGNLYFGSTTAGKTFLYANGNESDNGTAINAYWKSKDFTTGGGGSILTGYQPYDTPFNEKDYRTLSAFLKSQTTGTLTETWTVDLTTSTSETIQMVDPNALNIVRHNFRFPSTRATSFNVKYGNNAVNQPFELFGASFSYVPIPWRVYP